MECTLDRSLVRSVCVALKGPTPDSYYALVLIPYYATCHGVCSLGHRGIPQLPPPLVPEFYDREIKEALSIDCVSYLMFMQGLNDQEMPFELFKNQLIGELQLICGPMP